MSASLYFDEAAEQAAFGAALTNREAAQVFAEMLSPRDFYTASAQREAETIRSLVMAGEGVDVVTVSGSLPTMRDEIHAQADACPSATNIRSYAERVRSAAIKRRLSATLQQVDHELAIGDGNLPSILERLEAAVAGARSSASPAAARTPSPLDWAAFWAREHEEAEWVYPDVLARGRGHAFYAAHKDGKSLFMLWLAAELATGTEPIVVVYLDYEMTEQDVRERLADMGYGPQSDLSRLRYCLLPMLPPLDTPHGAAAFMQTLDVVRREWPERHLVVVIDTVSRAVCGEENSADTIRDFYNHTGIELKRRGITWARLDHGGKDPSRGQRGSSAKGDDVDVVWWLTKTQHGICLRRDFARMPWVPERVSLAMHTEPLTYAAGARDWPAGTAEVANILDRLSVPLEASAQSAQAALKTIAEGRRKQVVVAALRWRREHQQEV